MALAYGLTPRDCQGPGLCLQGRSTKQIAQAPAVSPSRIISPRSSTKTGVRSRGELVGQVFVEHYAPRWED